MTDAERIAALEDALADTLALASLKWGNLDQDANEVFARAESLLSQKSQHNPKEG